MKALFFSLLLLSVYSAMPLSVQAAGHPKARVCQRAIVKSTSSYLKAQLSEVNELLKENPRAVSIKKLSSLLELTRKLAKASDIVANQTGGASIIKKATNLLAVVNRDVLRLTALMLSWSIKTTLATRNDELLSESYKQSLRIFINKMALATSTDQASSERFTSLDAQVQKVAEGRYEAKMDEVYCGL